MTGLGALTAGERRVADRVAAGQSNRDIAATLHLTLRTVETHLSAVYRKLGITGRTQLNEALAAET
jgi:DNA-binding NarL/FixJ family response regulator